MKVIYIKYTILSWILVGQEMQINYTQNMVICRSKSNSFFLAMCYYREGSVPRHESSWHVECKRSRIDTFENEDNRMDLECFHDYGTSNLKATQWSLVVNINLILNINRRNCDQWYYINEIGIGLSSKNLYVTLQQINI